MNALMVKSPACLKSKAFRKSFSERMSADVGLATKTILPTFARCKGVLTPSLLTMSDCAEAAEASRHVIAAPTFTALIQLRGFISLTPYSGQLRRHHAPLSIAAHVTVGEVHVTQLLGDYPDRDGGIAEDAHR